MLGESWQYFLPQVSLFLLPVLAFVTGAPCRLSPEVCGTPALIARLRVRSCGLSVSEQQKEGKRCAVLFDFQGTSERFRPHPVFHTFFAFDNLKYQKNFFSFSKIVFFRL